MRKTPARKVITQAKYLEIIGSIAIAMVALLSLLAFMAGLL